MRGQLERGMALQRRGNGAGAAGIYRAILERESDNPDALHLLGLVLGEEDRHAQALELIHRALVLRPDAAPLHHNIAGLYRRMGRVDAAEASFRRAIELRPGYGEAYQGLAECVRLTEGDRVRYAEPVMKWGNQR